MKIWDRIKNFLKKLLGIEQEKMLNEPQYTAYDYSQNNYFDSGVEYQNNIDDNFKHNNFCEDIKYQNTVPQGIDFAIEQYISSLIYQKQHNQQYNSYQALTSLGALETDVDDRDKVKEKNLIDTIKNINDIDVYEQLTNDGKVAFYHIYKNKDSDIKYRIYLNCKNKNVPDLVASLMNEMQDMDTYYFKFNAQEASQSQRRSEQLVFYSSDEKNLNDVLNAIKNTQMKYPNLFEGAKNTNPFLKKVEGYIGYALDPKTDTYKMLDGTEKKCAKSYNSLLSSALEDSFVHSIREIVYKDPDLSRRMSFADTNAPDAYIQNVLEEVYKNDNLKFELIDKMKGCLEKTSQNNTELDIVGIDKKKNNIEMVRG